MVEDFDRNDSSEHAGDDVFSKSVRAGKRTYFFDVKATKGSDLYLTVTESKRRVDRDGRFIYEKHKIFLYKEDFEKFEEGLNEAIGYIKAHAPDIVPREERSKGSDFSGGEFEDLSS
ncbi:MAG: PUR family DNA/RNA-binding protein [Prevotellaceae bacterium]|jgi:hypothetical protein|nr:PUR family DNA/RNA-binding protein [Prevotellaceae bacterium]